MRKLFFIISAIVLMIGVVELTAQDKAEKIDDFIQKIVEYNSFTGSALAADNREIIFQKGYSFANREWNIPNVPATGRLSKNYVDWHLRKEYSYYLSSLNAASNSNQPKSS